MIRRIYNPNSPSIGTVGYCRVGYCSIELTKNPTTITLREHGKIFTKDLYKDMASAIRKFRDLTELVQNRVALDTGRLPQRVDYKDDSGMDRHYWECWGCRAIMHTHYTSLLCPNPECTEYRKATDNPDYQGKEGLEGL